MTRMQTMVQLTEELIRLLDAEAAQRGVSRSAVIREAVEKHLSGSHEAAITKAIIDGYTRLPQDTPDEWGDLETLLDASAREVLQRLDDEERAAGFDPW